MKRLPHRVYSSVSRQRILDGIAADYLSGMTLRQIADKHKISYGAARAWVIESGTTLRSPGGGRTAQQKMEHLARELELPATDQ